MFLFLSIRLCKKGIGFIPLNRPCIAKKQEFITRSWDVVTSRKQLKERGNNMYEENDLDYDYEKVVAYTLKMDESYASAIFWHGYRYCFTDYLSRKLCESDEPGIYVAELTEPEAWQLLDLWNDDCSTLACGSPDLIEHCQKFLDTIV